MLTQTFSSSTELSYAHTIYQLLAGAGEPEAAVTRARVAWNGSDSGFRSVLRAAGAFARNNDGYFVRYRRSDEKQEPIPLPQSTHMLVFPVPVEPRMRVAYSYVQGLFLKHLYLEYGAIPLGVRQGWAEIAVSEPLPEADELWTRFLRSGVARDAIEVSAANWTSGTNIGKQAVDDAFISESYLIGLARTIAARPSSFQWQAGDQIPAFHKEHLGDLADRQALMTRNDPEADEFRKQNRDKEWNTLQVYGWLEERSRQVPEFNELVEKTSEAMEAGDGPKEISLIPVTEKLEDIFRAEFVPRSSRLDWTELAIPKAVQYLLLWALVGRFSEPEDRKKRVFLGWDLAYLHALRERFDTPELRGSLKFMDKNDPKRGTEALVKFLGFDKLKAEIRSVPQGEDVLSSAPFELWNLEESLIAETGVAPGGRVCTVCGRSGNLSTASILPESKKRHYDNPQANAPADVCARCVQVWSLAPITTAANSYAVVEVPTENFLELFALYESLEGMNRLETLKTLNRVASLSVFPNKYLLLSRRDVKGKMAEVVQYYLQLSRQPHFLENLREGNLEVIAAQDRAKLEREVALTLSVLRRLPPYYATGNDEKVPAMSIVNALDRGRPYEALYVAADQAHEQGRGESGTISGGVAGYDEKVLQFDKFFSQKQKGASMQREIFRDVRNFSDYLDSLLRPVVREEVKESGSSVSGIARKYTENITKSFIRGNTADFLYRVSAFVEARERRNPDESGWVKGLTKRNLYGIDSEGTEADELQSKLKLEQELERYYEQYSGNERDWKTFLEEVEARTLALLLLNVRNVRGQG